jgi:hypothetical protein
VAGGVTAFSPSRSAAVEPSRPERPAAVTVPLVVNGTKVEMKRSLG